MGSELPSNEDEREPYPSCWQALFQRRSSILVSWRDGRADDCTCLDSYLAYVLNQHTLSPTNKCRLEHIFCS